MKLTKTFTLKNKLGLHARVAAAIVKVTSKYASDIIFERNGEEVDGKSILGILTLACPKGGTIVVRADEQDAGVLFEELDILNENRFGEE